MRDGHVHCGLQANGATTPRVHTLETNRLHRAQLSSPDNEVDACAQLSVRHQQRPGGNEAERVRREGEQLLRYARQRLGPADGEVDGDLRFNFSRLASSSHRTDMAVATTTSIVLPAPTIANERSYASFTLLRWAQNGSVIARSWSFRKASEKLASFYGEAEKASFSEVFRSKSAPWEVVPDLTSFFDVRAFATITVTEQTTPTTKLICEVEYCNLRIRASHGSEVSPRATTSRCPTTAAHVSSTCIFLVRSRGKKSMIGRSRRKSRIQL